MTLIKPLELELAWAAGFFDGEGHISARRVKLKPREDGIQRYGRRLQFRINQIDTAVLERFRTAVGYGTIYVLSRKRKPNHSDIFCYAVNGSAQIRVVATKLLPYVSPVKHKQITEALAEYDRMGSAHV